MPTRDDSAYILIHDDILEHPKIEVLTDSGIVLFVRHLTACHRLRTDGIISAARWNKLGKPRTRTELLTVAPGQTNPLVHHTDDRYEIHDYLHWQQSSEEIAAAQARSSTAGTLGNHRRWHEQRGKLDPDCHYCQASAPESPQRSGPRSLPRIGESR